jgi:uroporphyrinogen III methyltransferase/synthase
MPRTQADSARRSGVKTGRVVLVGAGPGDPDLLTVRAIREIRQAEVLLFDALIPAAIVDLAAPGCERIDVGKRGDGTRGVAQSDIAALLIEKARAGHHVVRLKGGDPFVFGRGGEEASALAEAGIPFEVVPGVSAPIAVPAYAGIPVTDRRLSSSVAIVTGHRGKEPVDRRIDWEGLARSAETLVILMGTRWLDDIVRRVIDGGRDPDAPAAVIADGTTPRQRVVRAPLRELPARVREAGLGPPTTIVIGEVARFRETLAWYERRPLFGRRILVTRAATQAPEWAEAILRRGAEPVLVPLLAFEPAADPGPLERALADLDRFDWLVFTSSNAVRFVADRVAATKRLPRVACVGAATAAAARAAGLAPDLEPPSRALPEELVERMAESADLSGARVLFPRAARAREALVVALEARGARVASLEAYRTGVPPEAREELGRAVDSGLDAVLLASPSAVEALFDLLGEKGAASLACRAVFACIGPTTAEALRARAVEPQVVSERQSGDDLLSALERHFAEETHGLS